MQSQSLISRNRLSFFGPKHPKPSLSQPHAGFWHFALPSSALFRTGEDVCHCTSNSPYLLLPVFYGERSHFTENHAPFDWLLKYFPISTLYARKRLNTSLPSSPLPARAGSSAGGLQSPVSPRFRQINCNDCKEAETYLALKDIQRKLKENILLVSAKGGRPAHESKRAHLSPQQILERIWNKDSH